MMDVILADETGEEVERFSFRHEHDRIAGILGVHDLLWFCPDDGVSSASLIEPLSAALLKLENHAIAEQVRAVTGYEAFAWRVRMLLEHCRARPGDRARSSF